MAEFVQIVVATIPAEVEITVAVMAVVVVSE
jgi:hypothetical protein